MSNRRIDKISCKELRHIYSSQILIIRRMNSKMRRVGHAARMEWMLKCIQKLVVNFERNRPLGRRKNIWEDIIKMDLKRIGCEDVDLKNPLFHPLSETCKLRWFIWLRIGTSGGLLWIRQWIFCVQKWRGIYWSSERQSASLERLLHGLLLIACSETPPTFICALCAWYLTSLITF
jgi:hypothetical protein